MENAIDSLIEYWRDQREHAVKALEVAEEMLSYYALAQELRREQDHTIAHERDEFNHHHHQ